MSSKEPQEERDRQAGGASPDDAIGATQPGGAPPAAASDEAETRSPDSVEGDGAAAKVQSSKSSKSRSASAKGTKAKGASSKSAGKSAAKKSNKGKGGGKAAKSKASSSKSSSSSQESGGSSGRLKPGGLDEIVLDYMRKHPDERPSVPRVSLRGPDGPPDRPRWRRSCPRDHRRGGRGDGPPAQHPRYRDATQRGAPLGNPHPKGSIPPRGAGLGQIEITAGPMGDHEDRPRQTSAR